MKKINIFLFLVICIISVFVLCSCNTDVDNSDQAVSIKVIGDSFDIEIGSFSFDKYDVSVTYASGKVVSIPLTEDMISDTEFLNFYTYGTKQIEISTLGQSCQCTFNVVRKQIKDVYIEGFTYNSNTGFYNLSTTYTGVPIDLKVGGDVPAGATISYPNGKSFVDVGSVDFVVYVSCDNYETKKMLGNITINKAVYPMNNVVFKDTDEGSTNKKTVVYDGTKHDLVLTDNLPEGVSVNYTIESSKQSESVNEWPINAGTYYVYADFTGNILTHEPIKTMTAILVIQKKEVNLSQVSFDDAELVYDGKEHTITLTNEQLLTDPNGNFKNLISFEYSGNVVKNAGNYLAQVNFYVNDVINYSVVESMTCSVVVNKANYDLSNVIFDSASFVYDGNPHSITISFIDDEKGNPTKLPDGVSVSYSKTSDIIDVGTYEVTANFLHVNDNNYAPIPSMTANVRITKANIDLTNVSFNVEDTVVYNGTSYKPVLTEKIDGIEEIKYYYQYSQVVDGIEEFITIDECVKAREYILIAEFTKVNNNYNVPDNYTKLFEIQPRTITESQIEYENIGSFTFDNNRHYVPLSSYPYSDEVYEDGTSVTVVNYIVKLSSDGSISNAIKPGNYVQETIISFFDGNQMTEYTSVREKEFYIEYIIGTSNFTISDMEIEYSGYQKRTIAGDIEVPNHPTISWVSSDEVQLDYLNTYFPVTYMFKEQSENDDAYDETCPVDVGIYNCKVIFNKALTVLDSESEKVSEVVVNLTITQKTLSYLDILSFKLQNIDKIETPYVEMGTYDVVESSTKTKSYDQVFIQRYSFVYDNTTTNLIIPSVLEKYGEFKFKYWIAYGDSDPLSMSYYDYDCSNGDEELASSKISTIKISKAGKYVFKISFKTFSDKNNCELLQKNDMFVEIDISSIKFNASDYATQSVDKREPAKYYDTSNISASLSPYVTYEYVGHPEIFTPQAWSSLEGVTSYYVNIRITIDTLDKSIVKKSFDDAVGLTPGYGIESITKSTETEIVDTYQSYYIKVKINYVEN